MASTLAPKGVVLTVWVAITSIWAACDCKAIEKAMAIRTSPVFLLFFMINVWL